MSCQANPPGESTSSQTPAQLPLFVYGTLRRGQPNYMIIRGYTVRERSAVVHGFDLYVTSSYPVAIPGSSTLIGELIELESMVYSHLLDLLDEIEGTNPRFASGLLQRFLCEAHTEQGPVTAWMYHAESLDGYRAACIPHGDWVKYQAERLGNTRFKNYVNRQP